ncbi:Rne/Rng family ribonuclease [Frigoribacterium sp. PhB116]|uniref:Rne/Rng family ribonuclease n=1 Tax=Frigoribacterium sp. PhB116 TaxID=2485174 RepID=UPI00105F2B25|nr:Rne/Rng family ribonuclease [Frigoribacterium sp. PhB116]TDT64647.1 ribonuclease E [Frigoribacterium sp. PhB116]
MVDKNDNDRDGQPKKKRGLFAGLLSRQVPAPATTARRALGTAPHDRNDDAQEASPVTTEKEVGAEAATSSTSIDTARPAQPEAVVDTEAVQADIAAVAPPRAEAPADDAGDVSAAESGPIPAQLTTTSLIFHAPEILPLPARPGRRRHDDEWDDRDDRDDRDDDDRDQRDDDRDDDDRDEPQRGTSRRRQRGRSQDREERDSEQRQGGDRGDRRERPQRQVELITEPQRIKGSTRLEAKKQRRRDGRDAGRRRTVITEAEFLARRESVDRKMIVRSSGDRIEIGVMEDGTLAEHYVAKAQNVSLIGNVYLGRVQNVLPSMEAAFVDIGRGRNAVLYSGEVDWDSLSNGNQPRRIELALKPGDRVLVQVTKDPVGHKGARLTSQISLPGRYLVYVPNGSMNGISRKLPDTERARLKKILKEALPENAGVIVRTAAEGTTEEQLTLDITRLTNQWADISSKVEAGNAPAQLHSEPDLLIKIVRDVFNEDFHELVIDGDDAYDTLQSYLSAVAPDLLDRVKRYEGDRDAFDEHRLNEQIEKALDRKVWLPSGGSLVIDRTEAMTVVDVNTGKFVGSGGNLEETVTKNNLEAAEEIVRQLRLRDIGGIIVVDFIDMVLESNRDLVLRRLVECLSRDRTKHQVAEVTSLGLVQMTRKKLGLGLAESFAEAGSAARVQEQQPRKGQEQRRRGGAQAGKQGGAAGASGGQGRGQGGQAGSSAHPTTGTHAITDDVKNALSRIAASTIAHAEDGDRPADSDSAATAAAAVEAAIDAAAASVSSTRADEAQDDSSDEPRRSRGGRKGRRGSRSRDAEQGEQQGGQQGGRQRDAQADDQSARETAPVAEAPTSAPVVEAPAADVAPAAAQQPAAAAEPAAPAKRGSRRAASTATVTPEASVAILDIPVAATRREPRKMSTHDAEQILDSVLGALPEPKQPGQGRGRSRRASSSGTTTAAASSDASEQAEGGPFILGVGVSSDEL